LNALLLRVFVPFACGYYLSYVYRNVNAAIFRDLVADLGLQASTLGLLTSAYFFAFAAAQVPVGLLLDRFGPRRVNAALFVAAAVGAAGFGLGDSVVELVISRAMIGLGVSAGLMAAMKSFTQWFPLSRLATLNGVLMAVGGLGAMTATAPVEAIVRLAGWRGVFFALAGATLAVAALTFWMVPERRARDGPPDSLGRLLEGLWSVLSDKFFWRVTLISCMTLGPAIALQGLWVGPWLRDVLGMDAQRSAGVLFALTIALTAGFLLSGRIADWAVRRGLRLIDVLAIASGASALVLATLAAGVIAGSVVLWCAYIFLTAAATLAYPVLAERFAGAVVGRVNASLNMATFVAAFAAQYGIGPVLDGWAPGGANGYPPQAYGAAFWLIVALQLIALAYLAPALKRSRPGAESPIGRS
jgi:MFS family permease